MPVTKEEYIQQLVRDGQATINTLAIHLQMHDTALEIAGKKYSGKYKDWFSGVSKATIECSLSTFCRLLDTNYSSLVNIPKKLEIKLPETVEENSKALIEWHEQNTVLWRDKILSHSDPRKTQADWAIKIDVNIEEYKSHVMQVTYFINEICRNNIKSPKTLVNRDMESLHDATHDVMQAILNPNSKPVV